MRRFHKFFKEITEVRASLRGVYATPNSNRTLTVNQVVKKLGKKKLAKQLQIIKPILMDTIKAYRSENNSRTDAVDISEFVNVYRHAVMNEGRFRKEIGQLLSLVE